MTGKLALLGRWLAARYLPAGSVPIEGRGRYRFAIGGSEERLAAIVIEEDYAAALAMHRDPGDMLFPRPTIGMVRQLADEYGVDRLDAVRSYFTAGAEPVERVPGDRVDATASNRIGLEP
jgi:hypothetical protein